MVDYPVKFRSTTSSEKEKETWDVSTDESLKTNMSVPPSFGGSDSEPSPESLYTASIETCFIATFKKIAERKDLDYKAIESETVLELDRGKDSRPIMKSGTIELEISEVENEDKAEQLVKEAEKNCFIHNSVKTKIEVSTSYK